MDMLRSEQIAACALTDWRKLAQGLHARFRMTDLGAAARFVAAIAHVGDAVGHGPKIRIDAGTVDLELVSDDAIYREDDGTEHVVEWVTQLDVDLARRISEIATEQGLVADPTTVTELELGLDSPDPGAVAPVWAALLTGLAEAQGRGTPGDEVRDPLGRVPNLWFDDGDRPDGPGQRLHVEVYVAPDVIEQRVAAAVAAGGTVVDDSGAPGLVVIADQDGNRGIVCADLSSSR